MAHVRKRHMALENSEIGHGGRFPNLMDDAHLESHSSPLVKDVNQQLGCVIHYWKKNVLLSGNFGNVTSQQNFPMGKFEQPALHHVLPHKKRKIVQEEDTRRGQDLADYWSTSMTISMCLDQMTAAVSHAVDTVFGAYLETNQQFMYDTVVEKKTAVPTNPSLDQVINLALGHFRSNASRLSRFAAMLPGFSSFTEADQHSLLSPRILELGVISDGRFVHDNDFFGLYSNSEVPALRTWNSKYMEDDCIKTVYEISDTVNRLGLTITERYLLLAITIFDCDSGIVLKNQNLARDLYYVCWHALTNSFGQRSEGRQTYANLLTAMPALRLMVEIRTKYLQHVDVSVVPWRYRDYNNSVHPFSEVMSAVRVESCSAKEASLIRAIHPTLS